MRQGPRIMGDLVPVLVSKNNLWRVLYVDADAFITAFHDFTGLVVDHLSLSSSTSNSCIYRVSDVNGLSLLIFDVCVLGHCEMSQVD